MCRLTAPLRWLFKPPLRWLARIITRRADVVLTTALRRELALHERNAHSDLVLNALLREVVRLHTLVEELLARQDRIEEKTNTAATTIPIRERSA
jgi:hypothetical protein